MRVVTKHIRRHWYKITKGGADKEYMKAFGPMPVPSSSQPPSPRSGARDTHTTALVPSSSQTPSPRSGARSPRSDARDTHTTAVVAARPVAARSSQGLFSSFQDDITDGFWVFMPTADQHEADEAACLARIRILESEISELGHDPVFADTPYYVDDDFDDEDDEDDDDARAGSAVLTHVLQQPEPENDARRLVEVSTGCSVAGTNPDDDARNHNEASTGVARTSDSAVLAIDVLQKDDDVRDASPSSRRSAKAATDEVLSKALQFQAEACSGSDGPAKDHPPPFGVPVDSSGDSDAAPAAQAPQTPSILEGLATFKPGPYCLEHKSISIWVFLKV